MLTHILPVITFAGAAIAACPLSVAIESTDAHIAHVAVTNNGAEPITVFKGNTVFSEHATKDVLVTDAAGEALEFLGHYVNYKKTGLAPEHFQVIQAGETITTPIDAAKTYDLAGVAEAQVTAIQGFKYVSGSTAPDNLREMQVCEDMLSSPAKIVPDQSKVAQVSKRAAPSSRIQKRDITYSSCSASQTSTLKTAVTDAISLAGKGYTGAGSGAAYYTTWFKSTSVKSKVQTIYTDVKNVRTTSPKISCTDTYGDCSGGDALLYTVPSANVIVPCPNNGFYGFPELASSCSDFDYDKAGSILHEMTHLYGTDDYAYGPSAAKQLSATQAAANADTYEMYANSVRLGGCS